MYDPSENSATKVKAMSDLSRSGVTLPRLGSAQVLYK